MTPKQYLSQARYIDQRIEARIAERDRLLESVTAARSPQLTGMPSGGGGHDWTNTVDKAADISAMIDAGMDNRAIMDVAMRDIPYDIFDELDVEYRCNCSKERMDAVMRSLGRRQVEDLLAEQVAEGKPAELEIGCRFCNRKYVYPKDELDTLDYAKP